jgi:flagellar biosynthesis protein FliQ
MEVSTLEVIQLVRELMFVALLLSLPAMAFGLVIGLLISIFQAVTQINEQSLTFVPKMVVVALTIIIFAPYMIALLLDYTEEVFARMITMVAP